MTMGIVAVALLLTWALTSWALHRTFDEVGRAVIADDLGEYATIYEREGIAGVRSLFTAGSHEHDQILRIVSVSGETKLEILLPAQPDVRWPDLSRPPRPTRAETVWHREAVGDSILTIGRRRLADGAELWFGRTDSQDRLAINRVHHLILLAMCISAALTLVPVTWFANHVLRPVRSLIKSAHHLASNASLDHRLESTAAIPELNEFARAFNESLDRVQDLTVELEAANDQLAHELRTPLARIRGNVESVLAQCESPVARESAARAIEEIERAAALIQSILSIRAGDARSMRLQLELVSLRALVSETCELYSAAAEAKDLEFDLLITGEELLMLVDRQRLQQALCNLLDNALAYTGPGGRVEVELEFESGQVTIYVRDSGPGLSDTDPARIWRRFMRGSAASASTPGIGLGLSLVKAVVNAHRGECGARNRREGGAEFWIRLPVPAP